MVQLEPSACGATGATCDMDQWCCMVITLVTPSSSKKICVGFLAILWTMHEFSGRIFVKTGRQFCYFGKLTLSIRLASCRKRHRHQSDMDKLQWYWSNEQPQGKSRNKLWADYKK
ncbi:hypothetical protein RvY_11049 [Ramazzottius varieornatus]|uniref:Uncharacterized protein n=1 Tax=Ramazzottius varieornatus TaxID=947166 RepID=A0A1D1VEV9_RAMVA|nr:hypothetical protein RvY_11049 [Ramazzottius varieornatus]